MRDNYVTCNSGGIFWGSGLEPQAMEDKHRCRKLDRVDRLLRGAGIVFDDLQHVGGGGVDRVRRPDDTGHLSLNDEKPVFSDMTNAPCGDAFTTLK
jgi:hypothetical protein